MLLAGFDSQVPLRDFLPTWQIEEITLRRRWSGAQHMALTTEDVSCSTKGRDAASWVLNLVADRTG